MTIKECYESIGADYADVLNRMMQKEALVIRFAKKFVDDKSYETLCEAMNDKNVEEAFRAAHTLKGVAQNLSLKALYEPASELTEKLRAGEMDGTEEMLEKVAVEYQKTIDAISKLEG